MTGRKPNGQFYIDSVYILFDNEEDAKKFVDLLRKSEQLDFIKYSISQTFNY